MTVCSRTVFMKSILFTALFYTTIDCWLHPPLNQPVRAASDQQLFLNQHVLILFNYISISSHKRCSSRLCSGPPIIYYLPLTSWSYLLEISHPCSQLRWQHAAVLIQQAYLHLPTRNSILVLLQLLQSTPELFSRSRWMICLSERPTLWFRAQFFWTTTWPYHYIWCISWLSEGYWSWYWPRAVSLV